MTEREPIGEVVGRFDNPDNLLTLFTFKPYTREHIKCGTLLYATPREWQGLTEAERLDILDVELTTQSTEHFALAQAIEAKLREKNGL